jgi:flagellar biosynthesis/type III secretory pathway protein FliH
MSHVTYAEIFGREEGFKQGFLEGFKQGFLEGYKKGIKDSLCLLLLAKFPQEGATLVAEFEGEQNVDLLEALLLTAGVAQSLDDFRSRLASLLIARPSHI